MRRVLGVVLGLMLLFSVLAVGTGTVKADIVLSRLNFIGAVDTQYSISTSATEWKEVWNFSVYHQCNSNGGVTITVSPDPDTQATRVQFSTGSGYWQGTLAVYNSQLRYVENASVKVTFSAVGNNYGIGVLVVTKSGKKYAIIHFYGKNDGHNNNVVALYPDVTANIKIKDLPGGGGEFTFNLIDDLQNNGISINAGDVASLKFFIETAVETHYNKQVTFTLSSVEVIAPGASVAFSLKDALSGSALSGVTVKEGSTVLGTIDDGGTLELTKGQHTLTFEKSGYWSVTKTIDVQGDMSVSVEMYPSSAVFKLENFPANISIPENTIYELTFTLSLIQTSATYNTYLAISGLSDVLEVRKDGSVISPEGGKYYLGDISSPVQVSIKFKAGSVGTHGFTITLTSNDAIMSKTYTMAKQVVYKVEPLPFSVQMPSEWQVGENSLRISESSGQSYLITAVLKDSSGNEVWSASHSFSPYEAYTFSVKIPREGSYSLELQWNGQTAGYSVVVNPVISLKTKVLNVSKGGSGAIVLHFKNPSSNVEYYTIKVSGGFLPKEINQSIAVAPFAEKDVSVPFAVPDNLQFDAYELKVQVLQGSNVVFQDEVAVSVSGDSGFSLFGGASSGGKVFYYGVGLVVALGGALFVFLRRR